TADIDFARCAFRHPVLVLVAVLVLVLVRPLWRPSTPPCDPPPVLVHRAPLRHLRLAAAALLLAAAGCIAHSAAPAGAGADQPTSGAAPQPDLPPLRATAAAAGRHIGVALNPMRLRDPSYRRLAA